MTRVFLRPDVDHIESNNGIGRVVHAQAKYLPKFDIQLVADEAHADVIAGHTHDHGASRLEVVHIHGLYWLGDPGSGDYSNWHKEANQRIIASMRRARVITVPSEWVGMCIRRDMRINPTIIGHGIEPDEWAPGDNGGYVFWGKNRGNADVCNPIWPWHLAKAGVRVVSTFGPDDRETLSNMTVTGALSSEKIKPLIQNADVYLATTKETFGIQTLEAMASGVPILGFDWGGTASLITHQEDGYLVEPGNLAGLMTGLEYIRAHRKEMSANARATAITFTWEKVIGQYAALYHELARNPDPTGVAVVIPVHNYAGWVDQCIESVLAQTYKVDEIIVVDDGSTDDSLKAAQRYERYGVRVLTQPNQGVAAARNAGVAATRQPLIVCIDADDYLDPRYVAACRDVMLGDRGIGLCWTGLTVLRGDISTASNWGSGTFDWEWQAGAGVPPHTNVPTGAMFRREMWARAGGYRQPYAPGEDAEFYTRGLSVGFTARPATSLPLLVYRDHGGGAHARLRYKPIDDWKPWMRDRAYPLGAPSQEVPDVRSYSEPKVSVIIPVGPGHGKYLPDALESLIGQNMRDWEVIVVNDSGDHINAIEPYPFVRHFSTGGFMKGPGYARNVGLNNAHAHLVLFLDADDQLAPGALAAMCHAYSDSNGRYIYGDWQPMGDSKSVQESEYDPKGWIDFEDLGGKHSVTVLMATADARKLKFDEQLPAWEDWDFFIRAALAGIQGERIDTVTLYARRSPESRTARAFHSPNGVIDTLRGKYKGAIMGGCCGGNGAAALAAKQAFDGVPPEKVGGLSLQVTTKGGPVMAVDPNIIQPVRMEFIGHRSGAVTYQGKRGSGRAYRGGNNPVNRFHNVHPDDVAVLESGGEWRRVAPVISETLQASTRPVVEKQASEAVPTPQPALEAVLEPSGATPEPVSVIETAEGPVKRRIGRPKGKNTKIREDLPPLDSAG